MDLGAIIGYVGIALKVISAVQSGLSNDAVAAAVKSVIPGDLFGQVQAWAAKLFDKVNPALQVVAAVQTSIDPDKNKTVQNLLNVANTNMKLGLAPLVVDGVYGPKTKEMAAAVQKKLAADLKLEVVVDGWAGQLTQFALQTWMQQNKVAA